MLTGDLNIREKEMKSVGGPPEGVEDAWVATGSRVEDKFTWDCQLNDNKTFPGFKPRARYDRMFFSLKPGGGVACSSFELVGKQRIGSCGLFPSDHFGMLVKFKIGSEL